MSEFYQEDIIMENNNFEEKFNIFKNKYGYLKSNLHNLIKKYIFDQRLIIDNQDILYFLTIHNIMDLVLIYHDYFLCNKHTLFQSAEYILEKYLHLNNNISSLSKDDKNIYISALIFINSYYSCSEYYDFIQDILDLSNYYETYCKNETKNMVAMIELEESLDLLNI